MRRRDFIKSIVGAGMAWPVAARAQQGERMRRIGVLSSVAEEAESKALQAVFRQALEQLGWTDGRNVQVDTRFGQGDAVAA
jgi:putative ABC transport system substrate-binding protein